jgi:hypothetical protein
MGAKLGNIPYCFSFSLIFLATLIPTTSAISSKEAFWMRETLLNAFSKAVFVFLQYRLFRPKWTLFGFCFVCHDEK